MISTSAFEIVGPIMVGPSSSHTAGACRIALVAKSLGPTDMSYVEFRLYNSFSHTYKGHGSDKALVGGMLGFAPDDTRIKDSFALAKTAAFDYRFVEAGDEVGLHPNTVEIYMRGDTSSLTVTGESLGGGRVRISKIDGVAVELIGEAPTLFLAHRDKPGVLANVTKRLAAANTNIATMRTFRQSKGGRAYTVIEMDSSLPDALLQELTLLPNIESAKVVTIPGILPQTTDGELNFGFSDGAELIRKCQALNLSIGEFMRAREVELQGGNPTAALAGQSDEIVSRIDEGMQQVLNVMREETSAPITRPAKSLGGLLGGQAKLMSETNVHVRTTLLGASLTKACAYAMATLERSATMGVIVAAPTAGSAGVCPGALLAAAEEAGASEDEITMALWNACAIGAIISTNASVAGAEGGCQAEVGAAAAMAASALSELMGASPKDCLDAASTAIGNLLGLVCDPVRGLVEHPCQDRNAIGVANAYTAAQLTLAGVLNPLPFDEVVLAMKRVGDALPTTLRETALGGLAATPSAATAQSACSYCASC